MKKDIDVMKVLSIVKLNRPETVPALLSVNKELSSDLESVKLFNNDVRDSSGNVANKAVEFKDAATILSSDYNAVYEGITEALVDLEFEEEQSPDPVELTTAFLNDESSLDQYHIDEETLSALKKQRTTTVKSIEYHTTCAHAFERALDQKKRYFPISITLNLSRELEASYNASHYPVSSENDGNGPIFQLLENHKFDEWLNDLVSYSQLICTYGRLSWRSLDEIHARARQFDYCQCERCLVDLF